MIQILNRTQNGAFVYTTDGFRAEGTYNAQFDGALNSFYATASDGTEPLGSVDVSVYNGRPTYNIHASELMALLTIAQNIGTVYSELTAELAPDEQGE